MRCAHPQRFPTESPPRIRINGSHHAHYDHLPRAAPPIPRRIASSKRLFASASRCEKPCLLDEAASPRDRGSGLGGLYGLRAGRR
jgi:hypothetical protein